MTYNLGAVGFGHWFNRLYAGLKESNEFRIAKVVGVSEVSKKIEKLSEIGLEEKDYYRVSDGRLPENFYSGLDLVHISDPNNYHAQQTIDSLKHGKFTVTEKTWGVDREEFDSVVEFIRTNNLESKAYLHLHYLHKQLTFGLEGLLEKYTKKYGKIRRVSATLFETASDEDMRRSGWLFSSRSGGLFMDTGIHLFEIIIAGAKADGTSIKDVKQYAVKKEYGEENATGVEASISISGRFFREGADGVIRIAKGAPAESRSARFYFERGAYLDLSYLHSDIEYNSDRRGSWTLYENGKAIESGKPKGPNNSEVFVGQIVELCRGRNTGLTMHEIDLLFGPQWQYQEMAGGAGILTSEKEVDAFISKGTGLE
jgi:predicted dehydrogenase